MTQLAYKLAGLSIAAAALTCSTDVFSSESAHLPDSAYEEAKAFYEGTGGLRDQARAFELFQKAADKGDSDCAAAVGFLYSEGKVVPKDLKKAVAYLQQAAEGGVSKAQYNLAMLLRRKRSDRDAMNTAIYWLNKASDLDYERAQIQLAEIYYFGEEHTPIDLAKAKEYLQLAVKHNNAQAHQLLGTMWGEGRGFPTDSKKAFGHYEKAASLGHPKAQAILGSALLSGTHGYSKNVVEGLMWLHLSAKQGEPLAQNIIDELNGSFDKETISAAQSAVEIWKQNAKPRGNQ